MPDPRRARRRQQVGQPQATPLTPDRLAQVVYGLMQVEGPKQPHVAAPWQAAGTDTQCAWLPSAVVKATQACPSALHTAQLLTFRHWVTGTQPPE